MAESFRTTRVAVVEETTESTPISPTSSGDYVSVRPGFDMGMDRETLENDTLTSSIGKAKSVQGLEQPTFSIPSYLKSSGVEGTRPETDLLLQSGFGGTAALVTERDAVSGSTAGTVSTRATVVVDSGEGADFERGAALLIKDSTNGFNIRCVRSISTDTLSLNFNLDNAPASGVNLGRFILYKPADTGHIPLTIHGFMANGANQQLLSGAQVNNISISVNSNGLLEATYAGDGDRAMFNPIEITATDTKFDFTDDGGTVVATITAQFYESPHALAEALETAANAVSTDVITVDFTDTGADAGKYVIASDGSVLSLLWSSGGNTANTVGDKMGFVVASDDTGSTSYTGDDVLSYASPQTPSLDSSDPLLAKNNEVLLSGVAGDFNDFACVQDGVQSITMTLGVEKSRPGDICASSGRQVSTPVSREATVELVVLVDKHDAAEWENFRDNQSVEFQYAFGSKDSAGNWEPGKSGVIYLADAVLSTFSQAEADSFLIFNLTLTGFVDTNGNGEIYLNLL